MTHSLTKRLIRLETTFVPKSIPLVLFEYADGSKSETQTEARRRYLASHPEDKGAKFWFINVRFVSPEQNYSG